VEGIGYAQAATECAPTIEIEVGMLYEQHAAGLLRYAAKLTGDLEESRDALQEIFLRYFVERSYGRRIDHPQAWLYKVLRNYLMERLKAAARKQELSPEGLELLPDGRSNPEAILRRTELAQVMTAVLSNRERDCLRLRSEGLCYADIAQAMGIRSGTVGAMLSRVSKKLRPAAKYLTESGTFEAARLVFAVVQNESF
jgi:RNA polymerase sigma-70 factor, ECF subfamily